MMALRSSLSSTTAFVEKCLFKKCLTQVRTLYSPGAIGVESYIQTRSKVKEQFEGIDQKFKEKMVDFANPETNATIFTEDLKNMVHLAEIEDLPNIENMIKKFAKQNKEMRFGSFIFGPVIMRMFYHLNEPSLALKLFKDPDLDGIFDQLITFQILMDLLLINDMYNEVIEVFDIIKEKQLQGSKYPKNAVVLVLAACYKLNTPESFEYMKSLYNDLNKYGHYPMRKAGTFAAALAIQQKSPHIALEILTSMKHQSYVTIRNLKISALADLGRPEDTFTILRGVLETDSMDNKKHTFCEEIITKVSDSIDKLNKKDMKEEFETILKQLRYSGHITDEPLSAQLCSEITLSVSPLMQSRQQQQQEYPKQRKPYQNTGYRPTRRPGLEDLA